MNQKELIKMIKDTMADWFDLNISEKDIINYVKAHPEIKETQFDTVDREEYALFLSRKLINMDWPKGKDSEEYEKEFFEKLRNATTRPGFTV